jgi:hypothetical protein
MTTTALNHAMSSVRRVWRDLDRGSRAIFRF